MNLKCNKIIINDKFKVKEKHLEKKSIFNKVNNNDSYDFFFFNRVNIKHNFIYFNRNGYQKHDFNFISILGTLEKCIRVFRFISLRLRGFYE